MIDKPHQVRAYLAYFWSIVSAIFLAIILLRHGGEKEILTLIIGLIGGGIIGTILGTYFTSSINKQHPGEDNQATKDQ